MNVMNPTGGAISRPVINSSVFPLYSLKDVLSTENIRSAWKQVRGNRGAPGIDDLSVDVFPTLIPHFQYRVLVFVLIALLLKQ